MIIVTDAHVSHTNENVDAFFAMLARLEHSAEDLVFLGDIFDLWIGLTRYEESIQRAFAAWCLREKARRRIGFVEGNHEFFVVRRHRDAFSWSSEWGMRFDDLLFVHGDTINRHDHNYLRWRKASKNWAMRTLIRVLPFGPRLVLKLKARMKKTNKAFRLSLPHDELVHFCGARAAEGVGRILVGHFHDACSHRVGACQLNVLPDWFADGRISRYDPQTGVLVSEHWEKLLPLPSPTQLV